MEIELIGRVDGRTFDERKLEFEVGEGLNVNIPRSAFHYIMLCPSSVSLLCLIKHWGQTCQDDVVMISGELNLRWKR